MQDTICIVLSLIEQKKKRSLNSKYVTVNHYNVLNWYFINVPCLKEYDWPVNGCKPLSSSTQSTAPSQGTKKLQALGKFIRLGIIDRHRYIFLGPQPPFSSSLVPLFSASLSSLSYFFSSFGTQ